MKFSLFMSTWKIDYYFFFNRRPALAHTLVTNTWVFSKVLKLRYYFFQISKIPIFPNFSESTNKKL